MRANSSERFRRAMCNHSYHTFIHATRPSRGSLIYLLAPVLVDKSGHDPTFSPQIHAGLLIYFMPARGVADVPTCRAAVLFNTLVSVGASVGRSGGGRPTDPDFPHKTDRQRLKSWLRPWRTRSLEVHERDPYSRCS